MPEPMSREEWVRIYDGWFGGFHPCNHAGMWEYHGVAGKEARRVCANCGVVEKKNGRTDD